MSMYSAAGEVEVEARVLGFRMMALTGPEVWRKGWRQLFLVHSQATVTSPLKRFIYYYFFPSWS